MTNKKHDPSEAEAKFKWRTLRARCVPEVKTKVAVASAILGETEQEFILKAVAARLKEVKS